MHSFAINTRLRFAAAASVVLLAAAQTAYAQPQYDPFGLGLYRRLGGIVENREERRERQRADFEQQQREEEEIRRQQEEMRRNPGTYPRQRLSYEAEMNSNPWAREASRRAGNIRVELFAAADCPACSMMEEYLNDIGVPYALNLLAPGSEAEHQYLAQIGRGEIPVVRINGRVVRGYNPEEVRKVILEEKKAAEGDDILPAQTPQSTDPSRLHK